METQLKTLSILQHNVRHWPTHKFHSCKTYKNLKPELILINRHGVKQDDTLKIYNYNIHKSNKLNDEVAIAIRIYIKYILVDNNFQEEILGLKLHTTILTCSYCIYFPPRRPLPPFADIMKLMNYNTPDYLLGDLNARHSIFGHNDNNQICNALQAIINGGKMIHTGPHFKTS